MANELEAYEGGGITIEVKSWCPAPEPTIPPTQVHVFFPVGNGRQAVMRFKSARALDELIDALTVHREDVWGKR